MSYIFESKKTSVRFNFNNNPVYIESTGVGPLYFKVADWAYVNGFEFPYTSGPLKLLSLDEVNYKLKTTPSYKYSKIERDFSNVGNSGKYLVRLSNTDKNERAITRILTDFGAKDIQTEGFELRPFRIKRLGDKNMDVDLDDELLDDELDIKKMTFIEAAQLILKENDNQPMSAREIWDEIEEQDLVETSGATPWASLLTIMLKSSDNGNVAKKYKTKLFHIISESPVMFILINPEQEVQPVEEDELDLPTKPSAFSLPDDEVLPFSHFRGVQSQEEKEEVVSPFMDAICILGSSGKGKSYTTELILDSIPNLEYEFIIPSASTTNLLAQFSPSSEKGGYVPSRLGRLIMKAYNNPSRNYVAVFDECHKANVIEMINDELLQCISTKRNKGRRFISLDDELSVLFSGLGEFRGNLLIPENFGFVFLSSKPDVITSNADFFNRVDIYIMMSRPDENSIEESFDYSGTNIKLKEPYFKHFSGKDKSDIDLIKSTFDEM